MMIGYARVSTDEQNLALQLDALRGAGCAEVFQDTGSGAEFSRAGLDRALAALEPGGVLAVWKLDRLGRSMLVTVKIVLDLDRRGVGFRSLTESFDTKTALGRGVLTASVGTPVHFSVLYGLWISNFAGGAIAAALERATNFLSVAQSQPSSGPLLIGHRILALSLMLSGDYHAALAHVETAVSLYRPDEHRDSALHYGQDIGVTAFVQLSWALWHCGHPDQSARAADRALALSRQLGHAHTLAHAFWFAGMAAVFARDVAAARAYGNNCVALASEHGFAFWAAYGQILQGWADAQQGETTTGIARIRDGLAAAEATGARSGTPYHLALLAEALALAGKIEEGLAALDEALAKVAVSGAKGWDAEIHRLRGELTGRLPDPDPAKVEDSFRTAVAIAREQGTRGYELRAGTSLARLWAEQGRRGEARDLLAPVYAWFTEGFDTADLKEAKALLDELT